MSQTKCIIMGMTNHTTPTTANGMPYFLPQTIFTVVTKNKQNIPEAYSCPIVNTLITIHINMRTSMVFIKFFLIKLIMKELYTGRRSFPFSSTHKPHRTTSPTYSKTNNQAYIRIPRLALKNGKKERNAKNDECYRGNSSTYFVFCLVIHRAILAHSFCALE